MRRRSRRRAVVVTATLLVLALAGSAALVVRSPGAVVVGSKNFTEQVILGEILAQAIERETGLTVRRRLNLGGTMICDRALLNGDIDVYVEYTGTALTAIFQQPLSTDPASVTEIVRDLYAESGRTVLPGLGYDNTFAILTRGADARARGLRTIDDVARVTPEWRAGFGYEFLERPDGLPGLSRTYGLTFRAPPQVMDLTLSYRALASGQVDLIAGDATAGLIEGLDLVQLEDNRRYFPPYEAVPVARAATLLRYPEVKRALETLENRVVLAEHDDQSRRESARSVRRGVCRLGSPSGVRCSADRRCRRAVERRVPVLTQFVCEARNECPGRSDSKIANPLGRLEELGEHNVLLS